MKLTKLWNDGYRYSLKERGPKMLHPGTNTWVYSKDTPPKKYLKEQYEFKNGGGEITPKIISLLTTAYRLEPSTNFDDFYNTLKKYLDVGGEFLVGREGIQTCGDFMVDSKRKWGVRDLP